ncbi:MAG: 4Fe-4S cluster-binding domain-containing protein [Spirochaetaceae bacterium]|nr:4Fe-4S cluster-binding domain-containing protein [Spirochaetaceae bacterium]
MKNLRINKIDFSGSICDGPGIRTVIFLQGCKKHCEGCHNPETWNINGGKVMPISDVVRAVSSELKTKRVTISGGEPLLQKESVLLLITELKKRSFDIALYTGYSITDVPDNILDKIDYIKTGEYRQELRTSVAAYIGSTNQTFLPLNSHTWRKLC